MLRALRALRALRRLATEPRYAAALAMRLHPPRGTFQPDNDTRPDRYPVIFRRAAELLGDRAAPRVLSFGCSVGDELFALRRWFPAARITGLDINRVNVAICRGRVFRARDRRMRVAVASSTAGEATASYDAIFCMAVLRRGALGRPGVTRCDPLLEFADFDRQTRDFARCLTEGGLLVIRHSNFRFSDTATSAAFDVVARAPYGTGSRATPLFGPDNRLLPGAVYDDTIFRKRAAAPRHPMSPPERA